MTVKKTAQRRFAVGAGALALGLAGALAMGPAAFAQEVGPDQPGAPTEGTLTINKYAGSPLAGDETLDDRDPLAGVEFTVTRVGIETGGVCTPLDLTAAAQWDGLEDLFNSAPAAPAAPFCLTAVAESDTTDVDGQVVFPLDVGVYFVQETDPGENNIVSVVPDFYVSIPTSNEAGGDGWNYDVVANPKNQVQGEPSKTIELDQTGLVVGDNVDWTISVPVPTLNNAETFNTATISDVLDSRLSYVGSAVSVGGVELTEDDEYTIDPDGVTWTFTPDGLALLDGAQGETITVDLTTSVDSVGDGGIPNADYSSNFNGTIVPGETVPYTYWGQLSIFKHDDSTPQAPLEGAEFQVFDAADAIGVCPADAPATGAIATGTSDVNGVVQWAGVAPTNPLGLWVANSENGPAADLAKVYCVYETVVPAGHTAVPFTPEVEITPGTANVENLDVENAKTDGPDLPLTGGAGTVVLMTGGLALLGVGVAVMVVARRRRIMSA